MLVNLKLHVLVIAICFLLNIAEHENFSANKYENANYRRNFHIYYQRNFSCSTELSTKKSVINSGPDSRHSVASCVRDVS